MLKFWPAVKILAMENIPILIGKPCDLSAQICAQLQGQPSGTRSEYGSPSLQSVVWFNLGLSKNQGYPKYPQLLYQVQCLNWGSWLSTWGILFSDKPIWTVFLRLLCLCLAGSMWLICFLQVATAADDVRFVFRRFALATDHLNARIADAVAYCHSHGLAHCVTYHSWKQCLFFRKRSVSLCILCMSIPCLLKHCFNVKFLGDLFLNLLHSFCLMMGV
jgi:hypothetical protein